jgi:hypothetical protein
LRRSLGESIHKMICSYNSGGKTSFGAQNHGSQPKDARWRIDRLTESLTSVIYGKSARSRAILEQLEVCAHHPGLFVVYTASRIES